MTRPVRVLLVEDQPLFRGAVAALLARQPHLEVIGEAENGLVGVEKAVALKPDLVIMDVEMPVMNGVEAVKLIREKVLDVKVIMLTVSEADDHVVEAMANGAHGYLLKNLRPDYGLIVFDAHANFHTPASRSEKCPGRMVLAALASEPATAVDVLIVVAFLSIQDPRERPAEHAPRLLGGNTGGSFGSEVVAQAGDLLVRHAEDELLDHQEPPQLALADRPGVHLVHLALIEENHLVEGRGLAHDSICRGTAERARILAYPPARQA